jgi:alpha-beta hydrolase superfamily lysophospholipase
VLAFDLRGHGRSEGPRAYTPSYDTWLDDLADLLGEARGRFPNRLCFLYGHSTGGNMVLGYALRRPEATVLAGVIATGPWLRLVSELPVWKSDLAAIVDRFRPTYMLASGIEDASLSRDPEIVRALANDSQMLREISVRMYLSAARGGRWALEHAAQFPVALLLMHGGADRVTSAAASREFARRVPGDCTFKLWDGFYHELHNEPERHEVFRFVIDWLHAYLPGSTGTLSPGVGDGGRTTPRSLEPGTQGLAPSV